MSNDDTRRSHSSLPEGTPAPAAVTPKSVRDQILSYLIPVIPLVILFLLFVGIILFTEQILKFTIPETARSFIFIILLFFASAVYLTKVLGENTSIKINGWALNGALAIIFVMGYFVTERFPEIAVKLGIVPPSVGFPFAEVSLRCSEGGDAFQTRRIYTFISSDEGYIGFAKKALEYTEQAQGAEVPNAQPTGENLAPVAIVKQGTPEYTFFLGEFNKSRQTDWLAYSVAASSGRVPIPTKLNVSHIMTFYIEPPRVRDGVEDVADAAPGPSVAGLIPVAEVTIEPKEIQSPTRHEITILLKLLGDKLRVGQRSDRPDGL